MRTLMPTLAVALSLLAGCSHRPTAPSRSCRMWPLYLVIGAQPFTCYAELPRLSCNGIPINMAMWVYRSEVDFFSEAAIPNHVLAQSREIIGCVGGMPGCGTSLVKFDHDAQGRLVRRERSWSPQWHEGGGVADVTSYTAWDRYGRPTQGQVEQGGRTEPVTIVYDDVRRIAQASNGELVEQDAFGNVLREVWVRDGSAFETLYAIGKLQDVCEEGA